MSWNANEIVNNCDKLRHIFSEITVFSNKSEIVQRISKSGASELFRTDIDRFLSLQTKEQANEKWFFSSYDFYLRNNIQPKSTLQFCMKDAEI